MKRSVLASLVVLAVSAPALAQDFSRVDVSAGYQGALVGEEVFSTGWYFDVAGNVTPWLGIVFQVGGNSKSYLETSTFTEVCPTPPFTATCTFTGTDSGDLSLNADRSPRMLPIVFPFSLRQFRLSE